VFVFPLKDKTNKNLKLQLKQNLAAAACELDKVFENLYRVFSGRPVFFSEKDKFFEPLKQGLISHQFILQNLFDNLP